MLGLQEIVEGNKQYATYQEMPELLRNHIPFTGNSVHARILGNGDYQVLSYSTEILAVAQDFKVQWFDNRWYSVTTSRLQRMIQEVFPELAEVPRGAVYPPKVEIVDEEKQGT